MCCARARVGYVLVYLLKTKLPWQGLRGANKRQKYERICEKKMGTALSVLCEGLAPEFATYIKYTRELTFDQTPNYDFLRAPANPNPILLCFPVLPTALYGTALLSSTLAGGLFRELFKTFNFVFDHKYDWVIQREQTISAMSIPPSLALKLPAPPAAPTPTPTIGSLRSVAPLRAHSDLYSHIRIQ